MRKERCASLRKWTNLILVSGFLLTVSRHSAFAALGFQAATPTPNGNKKYFPSQQVLWLCTEVLRTAFFQAPTDAKEGPLDSSGAAAILRNMPVMPHTAQGSTTKTYFSCLGGKKLPHKQAQQEEAQQEEARGWRRNKARTDGHRPLQS